MQLDWEMCPTLTAIDACPECSNGTELVLKRYHILLPQRIMRAFTERLNAKVNRQIPWPLEHKDVVMPSESFSDGLVDQYKTLKPFLGPRTIRDLSER